RASEGWLLRLDSEPLAPSASVSRRSARIAPIKVKILAPMHASGPWRRLPLQRPGPTDSGRWSPSRRETLRVRHERRVGHTHTDAAVFLRAYPSFATRCQSSFARLFRS